MTSRKDVLLTAPDSVGFELEPEPDEVALTRTLNELGATGDEITVKVYRYRKDGSGAFIASMSPEEFSVEALQERFGGGSFRVRVFGADGRIRANRVVEIEGATKTLGENPAPLVAPNTDAHLMRLVDVMNTGFQKLGELIIRANAPQSNGLDQLEKLSGIVRNLMPAAPQSNTSAMDLFTVFTKGLEFGKENSGEESELGVIKAALQTLGPALSHGLTQAAMPVSAVEETPEVVQQNPIQQSEHGSQPMKNVLMSGAISMLLSAAKRGSDPVLYADVIADNFSDEQISAFFGAANWFDRVVERVPQAAPYRAWCEQMREALMNPPADLPESPGLTPAPQPADNPKGKKKPG